MATTKATVIAITKHETHSYYVIILTFIPVILHCNRSFTLQWKLICIFFASESLWDFFFLIQTESHKNYNHPHQFTQSHVINFFFLILIFFFFFNFWVYLFIYLFMAVLGLRFCARAFSSCSKRGSLFIAMRGPLHYRGLSCSGAQAPDAQAQ